VDPVTVIGSVTSARLVPTTASQMRKATPNVPSASAPPARAITTPSMKLEADEIS
jgi:hypothetical protein